MKENWRIEITFIRVYHDIETRNMENDILNQFKDIIAISMNLV